MPSYSPYDWNESIQQRNEYIEDRLRDGSPVVTLPYDGGLLTLSVRQSQRKIYEIYDRLMFSAIGNHSDIEQIRIAAIDVAHAEGFSRSPEDVSIQRMVSFRISPAIKKIYSDPFAQPVVLKGIFAELGKTSDRDQILTLSYDGEFASAARFAVIAGTSFAEDAMRSHIESEIEAGPGTLAAVSRIGLVAWGIGKHNLDDRDRSDTETPQPPAEMGATAVSKHLADGWGVEGAVLERNTNRESRFRLLTTTELGPIVSAFAS